MQVRAQTKLKSKELSVDLLDKTDQGKGLPRESGVWIGTSSWISISCSFPQMLTDTMHGKVLTHFRPVSPSNAWFSAIRCSVVRDKRSTARSEHPACPAVCNNAERNTGYTWGQRMTSKHLQHAC